jgi:hypothetical protein
MIVEVETLNCFALLLFITQLKKLEFYANFQIFFVKNVDSQKTCRILYASKARACNTDLRQLIRSLGNP